MLKQDLIQSVMICLTQYVAPKDMLVRENPSIKELLESKIKDLEEEMESKPPKELLIIH